MDLDDASSWPFASPEAKMLEAPNLDDTFRMLLAPSPAPTPSMFF